LDDFRTAFDDFRADREWLPDDKMWWVSDRKSRLAIRVASGYFNLEYCDD
jgi:hypothetical protein